MSKVKVAIFGGGVVGGGIISILNKMQNCPFEIVYLLIKNVDKKRDFEIPESIIVTNSVELILADKSIDMYVEVIGGNNIAKDIVMSGLKNNKLVVTANKKLVAQNLDTLQQIIKQNPNLGYEAAVAGGIPIIKSIKRDFNCDNISEITGILNGTTNYILSKMNLEGVSFSECLLQAQKLGYAEADPTADVEGEDVANKLIILAYLGFNQIFEIDSLYIHGISSIGLVDLKYAKLLNGTIKMLGHVKLVDNQVSLFVSPTIVSNNNPLTKINGATNMVQVRSENLGYTSYVGEGAGRYPTANSIVSDMLDLVNYPKKQQLEMDKQYEKNYDFKSSFYIRFSTKDQLGVIERIGYWCKQTGISIDSILQLPEEKVDVNNIRFIITTDECLISDVNHMVNMIVSKEDFIQDDCVIFPILN